MDETPNQIVPFEEPANRVDTGLVTAAVTPPALPAGWSVPKALQLIDALARNLYDEEYTLKAFNLSKEQFAILQANEWFAGAVKAATEAWNASSNVQQRLALETALALEKAMPDLTARLTKQNEPLPGVVALAKLFAEVAGMVGAARVAEQPKERFKIIFNLGADQQTFEKDRPLVQVQSGEGTSGVSIQSLLEAPGVPAPVQTDPKGPGS